MAKGMKSNKQRHQEDRPEENFEEKEFSREQKKPGWLNLNQKSGSRKKK